MSFKIKMCLIKENLSVRDALHFIDKNKYGFAFTYDANKKVTGVVTDGDIRRALLNNLTLDALISEVSNKDFIWARVKTPREQLIKSLDAHIKFLPILDNNGQLIEVVSRENLPLIDETNTYIRARSPVRISFGGGGSDLTHFFQKSPGAVINATVSIYSHALMRIRNDSKIIIHSRDLGESLLAESLEEALNHSGQFGLIQSILHIVRPKFGFELLLDSDFSIGSGLGGSATLCAVILGCFNEVRKDKWSQYELAEIAFQAERLYLGISGGWQDQYATVFGGFNFIEFQAKENIVNALRIHSDVVRELEESLILCNTGIAHNSGNIHDNQKETMASSDVNKLVRKNVKLTQSIRKNLLKGNLLKLGKCLDEAWKLKRNFSTMISNDYIDEIYDGALKHGAIGGKLLGAGGGGYFIFYVPPLKKYDLLNYIEARGLKTQSFRFESDGLTSWTVREKNN